MYLLTISYFFIESTGADSIATDVDDVGTIEPDTNDETTTANGAGDRETYETPGTNAVALAETTGI